MSGKTEEPVMRRIRELFAESGKSLDELGQEMGHEGATARKAAWQFLNKVSDPRTSSLRRFCAALGISLEELFAERRKQKARTAKREEPRSEATK